MLTLASVSSAHFCTSQNVSIRALATLFKVSSELLASCLTSSSSITGRAATTALAPSRDTAGKRSWSASAQPFLHRASSSEDFCFSMSLQQRRRATELQSLQKSTAAGRWGQCGVLLYGSSVRSWICLHGEVDRQSGLVDMGDDDVCCWYHLRKTLGTFLKRSEAGGGVRRGLFILRPAWTIRKSSSLWAASTLPSPNPAGEAVARAVEENLGRFPSVHHRWR